MRDLAMRMGAEALRALAAMLDAPDDVPVRPREATPADRLERDLLDAAAEGQDDEPRPRRKPGPKPRPPAVRSEPPPEVLDLTERLVEAHGNVNRAAEAAGVLPAVFRRWRSGRARPAPEGLAKLRQAVAALDGEGGDDAPDEGALPRGRAAG